MSCAKKEVLLKEYRDTVAGYIRIVKQMKKKTVGLSHADYSSMRAAAKDCHSKSEAARRLLQQHISEHNC